MAIDLGDPLAGYAAYSAVKFLGYSAYAKVLNHWFKNDSHSPWAIGLARTLMGILFGAAYFFLLTPLSAAMRGFNWFDPSFIALPGLIPLRFLEWWLLLQIFFRSNERMDGISWGKITVGVIWSFILDIPVIFGAFVTGGLSVC
jgi:hypothetical protein